MSGATPFQVRTELVNLSVTVEDGAVTAIHLHGRASRPPQSELQRQVARELVEFARGERRSFTFAVRLVGTPFERRCWAALQHIPYGETRTYGQIAREVGNPHGARAVGGANHRNPIPIVVPCHRVVAAGGRLGGYGGGLELKRKLLTLEGRSGPALP